MTLELQPVHYVQLDHIAQHHWKSMVVLLVQLVQVWVLLRTAHVIHVHQDHTIQPLQLITVHYVLQVHLVQVLQLYLLVNVFHVWLEHTTPTLVQRIKQLVSIAHMVTPAQTVQLNVRNALMTLMISCVSFVLSVQSCCILSLHPILVMPIQLV